MLKIFLVCGDVKNISFGCVSSVHPCTVCVAPGNDNTYNITTVVGQTGQTAQTWGQQLMAVIRMIILLQCSPPALTDCPQFISPYILDIEYSAMSCYFLIAAFIYRQRSDVAKEER